ncbi:MAG: hypothetical protein V8S08_10310 [Lachnoclostridium sp.]
MGALNEETFARMKEFVSNPRVVAVGRDRAGLLLG